MDFSSAFAGLPYFSPMMMVNTSGTCATTRLIQCRNFGVSMNDVSRKFDQDPEDVPDLSKEEFIARRQILDQVEEWSSTLGKHGEFAPILYRYEIVKASAKRERDWGHLLFTDMTTTRFLLVMVFPDACDCGNYSHHDYDALTKYQADRFFSLAKGVYHEDGQAKWVRATYTTKSLDYKVDPLFLTNNPSPSPSDVKHKIYHVTPENFVPSLLPSDIEKINNSLAQDRKGRIPDAIATAITGSKEGRPDVGPAWKQKNVRQCALCATIKDNSLMMCSRCKLVHYCGPECQRLAWPTHKLVCKKA